MDKRILLGAHFSYLKKTQLLGVIKDCIEIGANSGAFYISNSRAYIKYEQDNDNLIEAIKLAKINNINMSNFIVHSPLVGNIANLDKESKIFERTFDSYLADLIMLEKAGIKYYNFHPGSSNNIDDGIKQIAKGINELHNNTRNHNTILLLETTVKKGNTIGSTFEELSKIISLVKDKKRIGVCIDTCHVWDAGYDIKNNLNGVLEEFDKIIGLKYLKGLHINDSKNELGSNKDRHEAIGKGHIGLEAMRKLINHPMLINLPKALETPYSNDNINRWREEIKLLLNDYE